VIFSPDGDELGTYKGYLEPDAFAEILRGVVMGKGAGAETKDDPPIPDAALSAEHVAWIARMALALLDDWWEEDQGGWGKIQKAPIAANLAYSKSFYEIFRVLVHYGLPCEYAWAATLRVKRGFSDTSQPGAFPKDHHYLKGYLAVKKYAKPGGDLRAPYIGKLHLDTIRPLATLNIEIREPRYLPRNQQ
jgi:hypothetical protein